MKHLTCSIAAALALSTFAVAGGDIEPVVAPMEEIAPAPDDSGFYLGGAVSFVNTDVDAYEEYGDYDGSQYWYSESGEADEIGFMLQAGYQFNQYIAVEGRYWNAGTSMDGTYTSYYMEGTSDSWSDECGDMTAWGIYLKPMYPVTDAVNIYALLGYGNTSIDDEWYDDGMEILDENGFQWGVGASYEYDEHISFFVDYVQLANGVEDSYDWVAAGESGWDYDYIDWETSVYTINVGVSYKF
jgi:hypothetical protein